MTPESFVMWLNGFCELTDAQEVTPQQWKMIKEHLALCTNKVTPSKIVGPIVAEPAKPVDWDKIFPKPLHPTDIRPYPHITPHWWDQGKQYWLQGDKVIC